MTSRRSSGSSRADSSVEPTRSQNSTVSWRRSASRGLAACGVEWRALPLPAARVRAISQGGNRFEQPAPVADGRDADFPKVVGGELGQNRSVDVIFPERLLVALQPQSAQPCRDVHARVPGPASPPPTHLALYRRSRRSASFHRTSVGTGRGVELSRAWRRKRRSPRACRARPPRLPRAPVWKDR